MGLLKGHIQDWLEEFGYDLDNEWFHNLSSTDLKSFFNFIVEVNSDNMVMSIFNQWKTQIWGEWEEMNNCYMNLEVA